MKASKVAAVVSALLATDAKPSEASILAAILAADKKGKDEGGLGPVDNEKEKTGKDAFPEKDDDKAKDEKDDEKAKDADMDDMDAEDEDKDDEKAKDADVQPSKSASGNSGAGGKESAKDKKGMDAAVKVALDARDALHAARRDVETVLGVVAYDSAEAVYKAALVKLGVDTAGVHPSAYRTVFNLARDKADAQAPVIASDAATVKGMAGVIKGYDRLK